MKWFLYSIGLLILLSLLPIVFAEGYGQTRTEPEDPEINVIRGTSVEGEFMIHNEGNETIHGTITVDQFDCAHHCPSFDIIEGELITIPVNGSQVIRYEVNSYWLNDIQELEVTFNVQLYNGDDFEVDVIVNVQHNYLHYLLCSILPISIVIIIIFIIFLKNMRKKKTNFRNQR